MTEKRTHDYVRHGTTNLFAALNVTTGEVFGECTPTRDGADFLAFLRQAVTPHAGNDIHVVLDNLSTHKHPRGPAWLAQNPQVSFHFTPIGSSWINQIEIWFGIITRQSIRRGTFASVTVLIKQIRDYITHWNSNSRPFHGQPPPTRFSPRFNSTDRLKMLVVPARSGHRPARLSAPTTRCSRDDVPATIYRSRCRPGAETWRSGTGTAASR